MKRDRMSGNNEIQISLNIARTGVLRQRGEAQRAACIRRGDETNYDVNYDEQPEVHWIDAECDDRGIRMRYDDEQQYRRVKEAASD
jgi:hypothetical protein